MRIEILFLFQVPMNLSKAWNAKLEAGIFWLSKNLYKQCVILASIKPKPGQGFELQICVLNMYSAWTQDVESRKNIMQSFGLIDARTSASEKEQPVIIRLNLRSIKSMK